MQGTEPKLQRLLEQMAQTVKQRNLSIISPRTDASVPREMSEFDFKNTLLDFPMIFSPEAFALLTNRYGFLSRRGRRAVSYGSFVDDLLAAVSRSESAASARPKPANPNYVALRRFLDERNTDLASLMGYMDKCHSGIVSAPNFARALFGFAQASDVARLAMNLKTQEVDYRRLQQTLDAIELDVPKAESPPITPTVLPALNDFAAEIQRRQIDLSDVFARKPSVIEHSKFLNILVGLRLQLRHAVLEEIAAFFADGGAVDCGRFLASVPKSPEAPEPADDIGEAEQLLLQLVQPRRGRLWPLLKPHDPSGAGRVPRDVFANVLVDLKLGIDESIVRKVVEVIADSGEVDYIAYVKQLCDSQGIDFDSTVESVLLKLHRFLIQRKVSLSRLVSPYDRDQSGLVPTEVFVATLRSLGYELTEHELNILRESYEDKRTQHFLWWKTLCSHVDVDSDDAAPEVGISPSMRGIVSSTRKQLAAWQMPSGSPREKRPIPEELIPLFSRIAKAITEFRFDLQGGFVAEDRFKNGTISLAAFKETIGLLPLTIPAPQLDKLVALYCDETTGIVYYESFCKDVRDLGTVPDVARHEDSEDEAVSRRAVRLSEAIENLPEQVNRIIVRLREFTQSRGISLVELFKNVDKMNTGAVSRIKLNQVLSSSIVSVSSSDLELLVTCFRDVERPEQVNYLKLCRAVDSEEAVPSTIDIGKIPTSQVEDAEVANLVHRLDDVMRGKRYSFTKLFQDQQPGLIPQAEFRRKIEDVARLRLSRQEWYLIHKKYKANVRGDLDWQQFCQDARTPIRLF